MILACFSGMHVRRASESRAFVGAVPASRPGAALVDCVPTQPHLGSMNPPHFCTYVLPRQLAEVDAEFKQLEAEIQGLCAR